MPRESFDDLEALIAVAREGSFTRAAARMGMSQSAISQRISNLEAQVGIRLLTRTTRSVSTTAAGEKLLALAGPRLQEIRQELAALHGLREKPAGSFRITANEHAAGQVLWPALAKFLPDHPDIKVEIIVDYGLTDIVTDRFDAGVRNGDIVPKDMIAVPISPDQRMIVVGAPNYLKVQTKPRKPQDLTDHHCINLRLPTRGGLYVWEFERRGLALNVRVDGQLVFNSQALMLAAALEGFGLAYLPEASVVQYVEDGRLVEVLADWTPSYPGYRLYFPRHRQPSAAFTLLIEALRYRSQ